jgi:hypothetical protein
MRSSSGSNDAYARRPHFCILHAWAYGRSATAGPQGQKEDDIHGTIANASPIIITNPQHLCTLQPLSAPCPRKHQKSLAPTAYLNLSN